MRSDVIPPPKRVISNTLSDAFGRNAFHGALQPSVMSVIDCLVSPDR